MLVNFDDMPEVASSLCRKLPSLADILFALDLRWTMMPFNVTLSVTVTKLRLTRYITSEFLHPPTPNQHTVA